MGWLVATSGRHKTSLCKTHEERPDGGIVTMCTYAPCMFAHGRRDRRRDPLVFTYEAELCPRSPPAAVPRASGGRDVRVRPRRRRSAHHPLTMLRELKAGRTPDLLRSTQRAEYPESPGRMGSPLNAAQADERLRLHARRAAAAGRRPPPAAAEAAGAQTAAAAPRVAPLSAAGKEMVLLEIVSAETSAADAACVECH